MVRGFLATVAPRSMRAPARLATASRLRDGMAALVGVLATVIDDEGEKVEPPMQQASG
jgi:hypothetical protein